MLAVFVNMGTVLLGSFIGILFRNKIKQNYIEIIISALALVTMVIGIISAVATEDMLCLIICIVIGTAVGTVLNIDARIDGAGDFIKSKLLKGKNLGGRFTEGFVSACILFCVGSMTIMGSFEAGINHNYSIIFAKSALDFVSSMMFGAAMGIGVPFSIVFILVFQGGLTLLANIISPYLGANVITEMSAVGGTILIGMGINMLELSPKKIKVANMLPAIFAPIAYIPIARLLAGLF
ncbi:MAG: DUF554 domain-containing protein [Oscillospiraceae bacterium]|nr:DUF554 domain-containing protein [Oscillospiraceae bacterium]